MIDKTIKVWYFVKSDFQKDFVEYLFYDRASRKWREDKMPRETAENMMRPDNTTEAIKFGLEVWKVSN